MLFTGDMEEEIDPQLLARGLAEHLGGPIDVLKVAHHGSGTATTNAAARRSSAAHRAHQRGRRQHVWPSCAFDHRRGCEAHGATVYRTDLDGSIEVTHRRPRPRRSPPTTSVRPTPTPTLLQRLMTDCAVGADRLQTYNRTRCPSLPGSRPQRSCAAFGRTRSCCATRRPSPRSPPSWPLPWSAAACALDATLVETAALLHDLDKMLPDDDPAQGARPRRGRRRVAAPARLWRAGAGRGESPGDGDRATRRRYEEWATSAGLDGRVVTYADKRARQDVLEPRPTGSRAGTSSYPDSPGLDEAHERARRAGSRRSASWPASLRQDVQANAWVDEALHAAA